MQRSYNGVTDSVYVSDFTDAASLNLGLAAAAAKVTGLEAAIGGGLLNLLKAYKGKPVTLGPVFGLRPGNYTDIMNGVRLYNEGVFDEPDNPPQYGKAPGSLNEYYPGAASDYAFLTASIPGAPNPALGTSADRNALNSFMRSGSNALNF